MTEIEWKEEGEIVRNPYFILYYISEGDMKVRPKGFVT